MTDDTNNTRGDVMENDRIRACKHAVENEGRSPVFHQRIMARHRKEWPTLWKAIDALLASGSYAMTRTVAEVDRDEKRNDAADAYVRGVQNVHAQQMEKAVAAARAEGRKEAATRAVLLCLAEKSGLEKIGDMRDAAARAGYLAKDIAKDAGLDFDAIRDAHARAKQVASESGERESTDNTHGRT